LELPEYLRIFSVSSSLRLFRTKLSRLKIVWYISLGAMQRLCGLVIYRIDNRLGFTIFTHAKLSESVEVLSNDCRIKLGKTIASSFKKQIGL